MASAWGSSWGSAWGNSWGSIAAVTTSVGSANRGGRGHRKHYLDIDGLLYEVRNRDEVLALLRQVRARAREKVAEQDAKTGAKQAPLPVLPAYVLPEIPKVKFLGEDDEFIASLQPRLERFAFEMRAIYARSEAVQRALLEQDDEDVLLLLGDFW